jgi:hypothetical protein
MQKRIMVLLLYFFSCTVIAANKQYVEVIKEKHQLLCLSPQFGFDVSSSSIQFKPETGKQVFSKQKFPVTAYVNISFNDMVGMEIGATIPRKRRSDTSVLNGEIIPGGIQGTNADKRYYSIIEVSEQPYIGLKFDFNFNNSKPYLFSVIGISSMKVSGEWGEISDNVNNILTTRRVFSVRKNIPFIKLGAYIPLPWQHFYVRIAATWFKTSRLTDSAIGYAIRDPNPTIVPKSKNTINYSLGIAYAI